MRLQQCQQKQRCNYGARKASDPYSWLTINASKISRSSNLLFCSIEGLLEEINMWNRQPASFRIEWCIIHVPEKDFDQWKSFSKIHDIHEKDFQQVPAFFDLIDRLPEQIERQEGQPKSFCIERYVIQSSANEDVTSGGFFQTFIALMYEILNSREHFGYFFSSTSR